MLRKKTFLLMMMILCMTAVFGCGKGETGLEGLFEPQERTPGEDEVFLLGDAACRLPELMVYLTNAQNQYENVFGDEIWKASQNGVTLEDNVKETALARVAQIKSMYLMAKERDVELTEAEQQLVESAAQEYFGSLNETEIQLMGVDQELIETLYQEYAMADKVFDLIVQDVNPEISDDEARTVTVQKILIKTYRDDGEGRVPYDEQESAEAYDKAVEIHNLAVTGQESFEDLAARYSADDEITCSFRKGEMEKAVEDAAFELETDEISPVLTTEEGYQILKCISTLDRSQTDANKLLILEERRKEAFNAEYDVFLEGLEKRLNESLWESVAMIRDPAVTTDSFFEIFHKYFRNKEKF